jgi:hypothetical protein
LNRAAHDSDEIQVESFAPRRRLVVEQLPSIVCERIDRSCERDLLSNVSIAAVQMCQKYDAATSTEGAKLSVKMRDRLKVV